MLRCMQASTIAFYFWLAGTAAAALCAIMFWLARRDLQRTDRARHTAVAAAVHELRASILCISGYSALLLRRCAEERPASRAIAREADRLERLTQDLLDQSLLMD